MRWFSGEEGQRIYTKESQHLPTIEALLQEADLFEERHRFFSEQLLPIAKNRPPLPVGAKYWDELTVAWQKTYLDQEEPAAGAGDGQGARPGRSAALLPGPDRGRHRPSGRRSPARGASAGGRPRVRRSRSGSRRRADHARGTEGVSCGRRRRGRSACAARSVSWSDRFRLTTRGTAQPRGRAALHQPVDLRVSSSSSSIPSTTRSGSASPATRDSASRSGSGWKTTGR